MSTRSLGLLAAALLQALIACSAPTAPDTDDERGSNTQTSKGKKAASKDDDSDTESSTPTKSGTTTGTAESETSAPTDAQLAAANRSLAKTGVTTEALADNGATTEMITNLVNCLSGGTAPEQCLGDVFGGLKDLLSQFLGGAGGDLGGLGGASGDDDDDDQ